jgi:hypothetical protein
LKEHQRHISLELQDTAAVEEHSVQLDHTAILSTKPRDLDRIIREASEIELHPNIKNREDGYCLGSHGNLLSAP